MSKQYLTKSRKYQTKVCGIQNMNVMKQLVKSFGKEHSCSAVTISDDKLGDIIVIQGDFCNQMKSYLKIQCFRNLRNLHP